MFLPKSNRINCKSNRMTFRFSIRFDSIRSGQRLFFRKALKFDSSKWKIHKQNHKRDCQIFLPSWWIITSKISLSPAGQSFFHDFSGSFVSNRIVFWSNWYWIEIESNGFYNFSIENRIESKPIRFDSRVCCTYCSVSYRHSIADALYHVLQFQRGSIAQQRGTGDGDRELSRTKHV